MEKWRSLDMKEVFSAKPWVKVFQEKIELPSGRIMDDFYSIKVQDFVVIYAENNKGEILVEYKYAHGLKDFIYIFPAGTIEDGEDPYATAKRELLEETGYEAESLTLINSFVVDTNKGYAKGHFFKIKNIKKICEPIICDNEELEVSFVSKEFLQNYLIKANAPLITMSMFFYAKEF